MILTTIQSIVEGLSKPCAFLYANLYEANGDLDIPNLSEGKEIFFVYIPPLENTDTIGENYLIHTTFPLQFFMMRKLNHPTIDYKSSEVEPFVDEMRELAREFIHSLNENDIVEKGGPADGITEVKYTSEYSWADVHLFGVSATCDVPIQEGKTGCV